jgi:hypothetical protein
MNNSMNLAQWSVKLSLVFFVALLVCLEIGYRIGHESTKANGELTHKGLGAIEAAVFALLGLLLGFSFAGATTRLDVRRQLIVDEANAIGTAYFRVDLLPASAQPEMRGLFYEYIATRIQAYEKFPDRKAAEKEMAVAEGIQAKIWSRAVIASQADPSGNIARVLLPAINNMIDVTTTRKIALDTHLPLLIFVLLISVALLSGLLAGYAMAARQRRSWLHILSYALAIAITIYAVVSLDYPRSGLIRLDAADRAMLQLRDSIH